MILDTESTDTIDTMTPRSAVPSTPVTIRFPVDLHQALTQYAQEHGRAFTAQVIYLLRTDLELLLRGEYPKP